MVCCRIFYTAPFRHILTTLACFGLTLAFAMRQVLPITIMEMTKPQPQPESDECSIPGGLNGPILDKDYAEKLNWSELQQALVLMGFYMGYSVSHFVSGAMINKFGARWPIFIGMLISTVTTGLIPTVAPIHWVFVIIIRLLTGVGQSVLLPGISSLLTFWIPLESRSMIAAIIYAGVPMGTFLGIYCSAIMVIYYENWHYAYYLWSVLSVPWLVLFMVYVYSYPETHPDLEGQGSSYFRADFIKSDTTDVMSSKLTLCSHIVATFGHTYYLCTLTTYLPKYMNLILNYELEDNSVYSATPFAFMYFSGICSRVIFRWMVEKRNINQDLLRIIYSAHANILTGGLIVTAFYFVCSYFSAINVLIHVSTFFGGFFYGGLNMLDLSYRYSGIVISIVNGCATTSGIVSIGVIAKIVQNNTIGEWQIVAWTLFGVQLLTWCIDVCLTVIKLYLQSRLELTEKKWYHNMDPEEHANKMEASRAIKEQLKEKQKGVAAN